MKYIYIIISYILCFPLLLNAEVITDGSVGAAGKINLKGPDYEIRYEYGHQAGGNLFHSFEKFNIGHQESATFTGPDSIENIITRVTGGESTIIDGLLRSLIPDADLYFLNSAGVVFGPDAAINIDGSFYVSTADYLKTGKNEFFYSNPIKNEVLSVSPPTAFGFLDNTIESITFDSSNIESIDKTVSVIGGDIFIKNNALITLNGGRLNLASAASKGEVKIEGSGIDLSAFSNLGNISISGNPQGRPSAIDVRYGSIFISSSRFVSDNSDIRADTPYIFENEHESVFSIQADKIEIKNNSLFSTDTFGRVKGTDLCINSTNSIDISNSRIRVGSIGSKASADAGELQLQAKNITLRNNTSIQSESKDKSTGNAGIVNIKASESFILSDADINTFTTGTGSAGNVNIEASKINIIKNGNILAYTQGTGIAGKININADNVFLKNNSIVKTESQAQGMAGNIIINTDNLSIEDKSSLSSASTSENNGGDAGNIIINAGDSVKLSENSSLKTNAESAGGGMIQIHAAKSLLLLNSEMSTSVNKGGQNGGDISIGNEKTGTGSDIVLLNQGKIQANADQGDGGAIFITTGNYLKSNNSIVEASSKRGNNGIIKIYAPDKDICASLTVLPNNYMDASCWVKTPCMQRLSANISRFVIKERDGTPFSFDDWLPSQLLVISYQLSDDNLQFINRGDFSGLVKSLEKRNQTEIVENILLSCAYNMLGNHKKALKILYEILPAVEKSENLADKILLYNTLGDQFFALGNIKGAITYIKDALKIAEITGNPLMIAGVLNNLANLRAANTDYNGAAKAYKDCIKQLNLKNDYLQLKVKILINTARSEFERNQYEKAVNICKQALSEIRKAPENWFMASDLISLTMVGMQIDSHLNKNNIFWDFSKIFKTLLAQAVLIGKNIQNHRIVSYANGLLGQFFEKDKNYQQAIAMTRKAIFAAQQVYAPEILYCWQWQMGRLFTMSGNTDKALKNYENAISTLNPIQLEYFNGFRTRKNLFENKVKPVYMELTELLMQNKQNLIAARNNLDVLKTAELQDFYQDECLSGHEFNEHVPDYMPSKTALIYPVLSSEHLSLLVTFPDKIKRFKIKIDADDFDQTVREFRKQLENEEDFLDNSIQLYKWLIHPLEKELAFYAVNTIIFAPDGVLRLIPFAALYDKNQFLVEKYALGLVPAMNLTNLSHAEKIKYKVLLNGISESRHGFPPLANVKNELLNVQKIMGGKILIDKNFTTRNLTAEFQKKPYNIVHMATHAVFGTSPQETFLLTYDDKLTMDKLDKFVRSEKYKGRYLDLLTLSACETALGDERSAFGLAGAALKAGAKSTLATLWETDDRVSFIAVDEFYRQLSTQDTSKAKALQKAQKKLINHSQYKHPAYWAPFILIGNWL